MTYLLFSPEFLPLSWAHFLTQIDLQIFKQNLEYSAERWANISITYNKVDVPTANIWSLTWISGVHITVWIT